MCFREHFESIDVYIFFLDFHERKAQNAHKLSKQDASANMLRQTVTLATAIFLSVCVCVSVCPAFSAYIIT